MNSTFNRFVLAQDGLSMTKYLDRYTSSLNLEMLDRWFHQAARLPGNCDNNRNTWLQEYYEKYVPLEVRKNVNLTDRQLFPSIPEIKIPITPDKNKKRPSSGREIRQVIHRRNYSQEITIVQRD